MIASRQLNAMPKPARLRAYLASLVLLASWVIPGQLAAQANTVWTLNPAIPHASASTRSYYPTEFTVHRLDSAGGHVQARVIKPGEPNCYALIDYDWTFSSPLDVVHQGDVIEVKIELTANPGPQCPPPLDPQMSVNPVEGTINNTEIAGTFSQGDRQLVLWHPQTPPSNGRIDLVNPQDNGETGDIFQLMVDDTRTSTGANYNAERGAFKLQLGYRGNLYEVYYIFSAQ